MFYSTEYDSPVGRLTLASDGQAICGLWLEGQKYHGAGLSDALERNDQAGGFDELRVWLDAYFAGGRPSIGEVPLAPIGSEFQRLVWQLLAKIPYGEVTTYGALADQVARERNGRRTAPLAIGGAVGRNPISIVIPCHRVVGSDGSLTGYAGGLARKMWLLEHEGVKKEGLYVPKRGTAL